MQKISLFPRISKGNVVIKEYFWPVRLVVECHPLEMCFILVSAKVMSNRAAENGYKFSQINIKVNKSSGDHVGGGSGCF